MKTLAIRGPLLLALMLSGAAANAEIFIRKGNQEIDVVNKNGSLFCTRLSDGYEMCNGMKKGEDGAWRGRKMKHPDMPRFMSFNGTVSIGTTGLKIRGCALGMCDSEVWTRK